MKTKPRKKWTVWVSKMIFALLDAGNMAGPIHSRPLEGFKDEVIECELILKPAGRKKK